MAPFPITYTPQSAKETKKRRGLIWFADSGHFIDPELPPQTQGGKSKQEKETPSLRVSPAPYCNRSPNLPLPFTLTIHKKYREKGY